MVRARHLLLLIVLASALAGLAAIPAGASAAAAGDDSVEVEEEGEAEGEEGGEAAALPCDGVAPQFAVKFLVFDRRGTQEDDDDVFIEGASILVVDSAGDTIDEVTTASDGCALAQLPGEGQFVARLDLESLPGDVGLPTEGGEVRTIDPNRSRVVQFPLDDRERAARTRIDEVKQTAFDGLKFGLFIAMCSAGLSLIFGTTGLTNFAHGEIVTFGAVVTWFLVNDHGVNLILAAVIAMIVTGAAGGAVDRVVWRPLRRRGVSLIAMMVVSIGLAFLVRNFFQIWFGPDSEPYAQYSVGATRTYHWGGLTISTTTAVTLTLSVVVLVISGLLLQRTRLGKAIRAVADNPDLAASSGIDVDRVILVVWVAGAALAGLGGVFLGLSEEVRFELGGDLLLLMFAAIVVGGLGTAYGALVGGLAVGLLVQLSTLLITPNLKTASGLILLIVVLLFRPQGILGRAERIG